jgi:hypothetical protein
VLLKRCLELHVMRMTGRRERQCNVGDADDDDIVKELAYLSYIVNPVHFLLIATWFLRSYLHIQECTMLCLSLQGMYVKTE